MAGKEPSAVPQAYRPATRWTAEQLHPEHQKWLSTWPKTLTLQIADLGSVLFCHATPQNENDIFTRLTPDDRLLPLFEALQAAIVVCGHTHMQFDRSIGRSRVVNAGSVGMPFGEPVANWLLLGPDIQFRHTAYDLAHTAERIRSTNYPQAQHFAERYILNPPTETDARVIHPRRILRQPQIKKSALPASVKQKKARKIPSRPFSESSKGCPAVSIPANVSFRPKQTDAFSSTFAPAKVSVCAVEKSLFVLSRSPDRFPTL
jgi:diadenosine tetraphosphatase ApaH/serine/threonine PP2A family protein phosphatase